VQHVFVNATDGFALNVEDVAKGTELVPMVRIRAESGNELLITEINPVHIECSVMVKSKYLREGDVDLTK
jgi:hypothetical protein